MIAFRIALALAAIGLVAFLLAFLITRDRRHLRRAMWWAAACAVLALGFFGGLFVARL